MDFPANLTIGDVIAHHGASFGERQYLVFEDARGSVRTLTYAEVDSQSNIVGRALLERGLTHGDRVLVMMRNSVEVVILTMACAKAGLVAVPINTASVESDISDVFDLVSPRAIVADEAYAPIFSAQAGGGTRWLSVFVSEAGSRNGQPRSLSWDDLLKPGAEPLDVKISSDDLFHLLMTSGTTARPKAVMHTHANRLRSGFRSTLYLGLTSQDRSLNAFPAFHINCLDSTLFAALTAGSTAILLERFSASRFWDQVRRHGATIVSAVPTIIRALLAQPPASTDRHHAVRLVAGALLLTPAELEQFRERFGVAKYITGYGLTEAAMAVLQTLQEGDLRYPSMGLPMIDREVELVDEQGRPVPAGEVGEITVKGVPGRTIMKGYFGDPEGTRAAIRDGWLYTGDLARRDDAGYFYFAGRVKDMIKRSGENISALEVETVVLAHPAVREAAVIGVPDAYRDEAVKAVVILEPGTSLTLEGLVDYCRGRLADFKIPSQLEIVEDLPRGLLGKVDKKPLRARNDIAGKSRT